MNAPAQTIAQADTIWAAARSIMGVGDRPEQTALFLRALTDDHKVTAMQGPTGSGKSMYAVPVLLNTHGGRVVYACATKSQQRQVHNTIGRGLADAGLGPSALLFGRNEYYCQRRASENREFVAAQLRRWRWDAPPINGAGLRSDHPDLAEVWWLVCSDADDGCSAKVCQGADAHTVAKSQAGRARLLIVNHHLLTIAGGLAVPGYDPVGGVPSGSHEAVIVDEAHELPDILASVHGATVTVTRLRRAAKRAEKAGGDIPSDWEKLTEEWGAATLPAGFDPQLFKDQALADELAGDVEWMADRLVDDEDDPPAGAAIRMLHRLRGELEILASDHNGFARWIEKPVGKAKYGKALALPLDVAPYADLLFGRHPDRITVMSATLAGHPANRLGIGGQVLVGRSPFDLGAHRLGYVTQRKLDADGWRYVQSNWPDDEACDELADLIKAAGGRTLILATSHRSKERCRDRLLNRGVKVDAQGKSTATVPGLVERLREGWIDALVGVDSLATGIDIPGDALSLVVWLAWPNPETRDPYGQAVNDRFGSVQEAWAKYWTPAARLKTEQGIGRLIRTPEDRGAVALLDPRYRFKKMFAALVAPSKTIPSLGAVRHHFAAASV